MPTIYTDGQDLPVDHHQAETLKKTGLAVDHPGVGDDGIMEGDLKLSESTTWEAVAQALLDDAWCSYCSGYCRKTDDCSFPANCLAGQPAYAKTPSGDA